MGDPRRKKKKWLRPRKVFDKTRIEEEHELVKKYGLKNKREIWKAEQEIARIRKRAKQLLAKPGEQKKFVEKLKNMGFNVSSIDDVLSLSKEDWLERRLQTIVYKKGMARTAKQARQLIVHRHVVVGDKIVNKPSFFVTKDIEQKIKVLLPIATKTKKQEES